MIELGCMAIDRCVVLKKGVVQEWQEWQEWQDDGKTKGKTNAVKQVWQDNGKTNAVMKVVLAVKLVANCQNQ